MSFLSSFFYFSVFLLPFTICDVKMIKIFGKVTETTERQAFDTVKDCIDECFEDPDCLLAFFKSECFHYYVTDQSITVLETDRSEGSYVAFKTELPDATCPAYYKEIKFSVTSETGDKYSWNKIDNGWSYKSCKDGWARYPKSNGDVLCVKVELEKVTQLVAKEKCSEQGGALARMATEEECEWKHAMALAKMGGGNTFSGFWLAGKTTTSFLRYQWAIGYDTIFQDISYTSSDGNCLAIFASFAVSDMPCDLEMGYMCEYVLE